MSMDFQGFPTQARSTPIPNVFFSDVLPCITDLTELKVMLHIFWSLRRKKGYPRYLTRAELGADRTLAESLRGGVDTTGDLDATLEALVTTGLLLRSQMEGNGRRQAVYVINDAEGRKALSEKGAPGTTPSPVEEAPPERPNIFTLYEDAIGTITYTIAEELKEAEARYPEEWTAEAFRIAAEQNVRRWRYVERILERWEQEGKDDDGASGRSDKKTVGRYIQGKRGPLVPWR